MGGDLLVVVVAVVGILAAGWGKLDYDAKREQEQSRIERRVEENRIWLDIG